METNVNYTIVGAFVIILTIMIVLTIIWLSSGFSFENYQFYVVKMEESVSGLSVDAPVEFNGVNVGIVKKIKLSRKDPHLVKLLLSIKSSTPITQGTVATLNSRGVTGITYVALKDVGSNVNPLTMEPGEHYPVIKSAPSLFNRLDTTLSELSVSFRKVTQSIQSLLDKENLELIKETLRNISRFTGTLSTNGQNFNSIIGNTQRASEDFSPLIKNLIDATQALSQITIELKENPSILIRGVGNPPLGPGEH